MSTLQLSSSDRLDIVDALYRLGAGIDEADAALIDSALTDEAIVDFGPAARFMGIDFPILTGSLPTSQTLAATVGQLDTTHVVSNPRIERVGDQVVLKAVVEAAHFMPGNHARRCVMKNRYVAHMRQELGQWRISNLQVTCAWYDGDPKVLLGQ